MPAVAQLTNRCKYELGIAGINLESDSIKMLLMKSGFVFDPAVHNTILNIKTDSTAITINVNATARTFTRTTGSFITDGFVPGNNITTSGFTNAGNNGDWIIESVTATVITVVDGTGLVTESGGGDEQIVSDDELATGNGYTQDTMETGTITGIQDDDLDRGTWSWPTVVWEASGGSIGPSPCILFYDDDHTDDIIIGAYTFAAEAEATDGEPFEFANGTIHIA